MANKNKDPEIKMVRVDELIPYVNNSRTHSDKQVDQIAASIKEFGFTNPILTDGDKGIIAGHGRLMAAKKLKLELVPTIELAYLSEAQKKALVIADNKLALNSAWDMDILKVEIEALSSEFEYDLEILGFEPSEIESVLDLCDDEDDFGEDQSGSLQDKFEIIVNLPDECAQTALLDRLIEEGFDCRALT